MEKSMEILQIIKNKATIRLSNSTSAYGNNLSICSWIKKMCYWASCLGGGDQEDHGSRLAQAKS
jgi:hypothetical protein